MFGDLFGNMSLDGSRSSKSSDEDGHTQDAQWVPHSNSSQIFCDVGYEIRDEAPIMVRQIPEKGISFQLWPAATGLCWYLEQSHGKDPPNVADQEPSLIVSRPKGLRNLRVLELGAGTGMVGVLAARLGGNVTLSDLLHVLPNLRINVELNQKEVEAAGGSLDVQMLRWGFEEDIAPLGAPFDLILASDCVYHDTLFEPLMKTLKWLVGSDKGPIVLLAHLRRWKKDGHFFRMASKFFNVEVVHRHPPPENDRIGVIVYKFTRRITS